MKDSIESYGEYFLQRIEKKREELNGNVVVIVDEIEMYYNANFNSFF